MVYSQTFDRPACSYNDVRVVVLLLDSRVNVRLLTDISTNCNSPAGCFINNSGTGNA